MLHSSGRDGLASSDKEYLWHPFTQMKEWIAGTPVVISGGEGCYLVDTKGRRYLDGVSSLWVNIHGHRRREIDDALKAQIDRISHTTMLGLSNVPAIILGERLANLVTDRLPHQSSQLCKVFYSDNGSTSVEVALKMAYQYWQLRGQREKTTFVSLRNGYHGDTLGAVSVGGVDIFHDAFRPLLFPTYKVPSPYCYRCELGAEHPACGLACLSAMEAILKDHCGRIAAVILEPHVQAAGGMIVFPDGYVRGVRELCTKYGVLLIADEVATGFGRTGRMFACEHEAAAPDLLCLSKGITGGYLPLAVTLATQEIYEAFLGEFRELKTFFHGHSYTGNPLGCAAANACLDIFEKEDTLGSLVPKTALLRSALADIAELPSVGDVRSLGLMAGVELVRDKSTKEPYPWEEKRGWRVARHALEQGVFLRPLGNVVVIMPPLAITEQELTEMLSVIRTGILQVSDRA